MVYFSPRSRPVKPFAALIAQYVLSLAVVGLTSGILVILRSYLSASVTALLFFIPVGVSAAIWGLGPGILSALVGFLALNYFFILPLYSFRVHQTQDLIVLLIFLGVAVVINYLVSRTQAGLAEATARERETTWLYELSTSLAGQNDSAAIARILSERTRMIFQADFAQVSLEPAPGMAALSICEPEKTSPPKQTPEFIVPLQTARGLLGELCLWRLGLPASPSEEHLLRAFASQAALALDRANLAEADRRAQLLEESDRLKSSLLSSVSHELRTPLATIKASVSSLLSEDVDWDSAARRELLEAIEEETDHLNQLVGNLLDMTRIEAGALKPQLRWNVFAEIVSGVLVGLRKSAAGHHLVNEVSNDLPLVPVDYTQMDRVLCNLVSNSIKYSPEGTTIRIRAWVREDHTLQVQVSNQGPHVPEESLGRIFDKFYRITAADQVTGTGLGLSICKGFVEAHSGSIWAENLPDGLAFNFTLPLTRQGAAPLLPVEL